jgi:hypothetical protein
LGSKQGSGVSADTPSPGCCTPAPRALHTTQGVALGYSPAPLTLQERQPANLLPTIRDGQRNPKKQERASSRFSDGVPYQGDGGSRRLAGESMDVLVGKLKSDNLFWRHAQRRLAEAGDKTACGVAHERGAFFSFSGSRKSRCAKW